ncbi:hypothetical protein PTSG_01738 [Salpingoeca rosetta]|uniref:Ciliary microtubule inner protein 2A-C-like domain-containing protein n=1 Tax=Salpingoeca rosetta (strain ATCC 50818 / BSB-021) TaxID=946362 RepID=F2TYT6_SALR5|nr:uncharacterized protein PTSG_01738 [Salpingoeca rosetta]XP_012493083.1 hypothetical protein, variant [Salpingoeca rosetta]EGD78760.1 hypothetical protein, variant [Salpingoeca rosetta]EGD78761.1 hypothetical protein PTSG_01738 [Salpingoeca rosetta]|eukprot:XP_004997717.1 hypothetical protein PTSG_01738 [Salpingoeca rosetta]
MMSNMGQQLPLTETSSKLQRGTGRKSILPTPRAIPGYQGHVHGLRDYDPGRRFGSSSSHLLATRAQEQTGRKHQDQSKTVPTRFLKFSRPSRPAVPMLDVSKASSSALASLPSEQLQEITLAQREESRDCAYRGNMVPGYSGHVPRLRDRVAQPFGNATADAISDFDKHRVRTRARQQFSRSAPLKQPLQASHRETRSAEALAFESNKNLSSYNAAFTERTPYSRKAGAIPGTTVHVPFQQHTSLGRTYQEAVKESAKALRASRPGSHYSSRDATLSQIARARQHPPAAPQNKPMYTHVEKRDFVVSPRFGFHAK